MGNLRVMTWNLRTFGLNTMPQDLELIAEIIHNSKSDIVCIQEIQLGNSVAGEDVQKRRRVSCPVGPSITKCLDDLLESLQKIDKSWTYQLSDCNKGKGIYNSSMRDAYGFFYKCSLITLKSEPEILDSQNYGGLRRPGKISFNVTTSSGSIVLDIISIHGATPPNSTNSSWSTRNLVEFAGGIFMNQKTGVPLQSYPDPKNPTIVLGDFNNTPDCTNNAFKGLTTPNHGVFSGYSMLLKIPTLPTTGYGTTYSPKVLNPAIILNNIYDNILSLNIMTTTGGETFDFINKYLGILTSLSLNDAFHRLYKQQYKGGGISDHLPVYQDFTM